MSNIDKRALREAAEKATKGEWAVEFDDEVYATDGVNNEQIAMVFSENEARDAAFIATANPATVLTLLDELEAKDRKILKLEKLAEAESVGADKAATSCVEWMKRYHAAEKRIAELEALGRGVKQFSEFQICHYGATEDYAKGYIDCQNNYNKVLFAAAGKGE
ncbi:TPA: ead/Ea22-like family protein [Escherichia coli]|nr:ead/Ea22-like family protein [Escherichia coli]